MRALIACLALFAVVTPAAQATEREWPVAVTGDEYAWLQPLVTRGYTTTAGIMTRSGGRDKQLAKVRGSSWPRIHAGGGFAAVDLGEDVVRVRINDGVIDIPQPDKPAWRDRELSSEPDPSNCDTRPELNGIDSSGTVALTRIQPKLPPCGDGPIAAQFEAIGVSPDGHRSMLYVEPSTMPWDYVFAGFLPFKSTAAGWIAYDEYRVDRIENGAAVALARRTSPPWSILLVDASADGRVVTVEERTDSEEGSTIATKVVLSIAGGVSTVVPPLNRHKGAIARFCGDQLFVGITQSSRSGDRLRELRIFDAAGVRTASPVKKSQLKTAAAFDCSASLLAISRVGARPLTKRLSQ